MLTFKRTFRKSFFKKKPVKLKMCYDYGKILAEQIIKAMHQLETQIIK